ncbi:MAG: TIGR03000 domain-containing protein [Planctomycetes bacterium]|nr:TIGR03000 domain-containing protein [Planctomycetota bacterium]
MQRTVKRKLLVTAALVAGVTLCVASSASAGWHMGMKNYYRFGVLYGYPGARYQGGGYWGCPYNPVCTGPWCYGLNWCGPAGAMPPSGPGAVGVDRTDTGYQRIPNPGNAIPNNSLLFNLQVPADALVFVNGFPTRSTGATRTFMATDLEPGRTYAYEVSVETYVNGEPVVENRRVVAKTGDRQTLAFNSTAKQQAEVIVAADPRRGTLTLHVPADAKVLVDGQITRSTGEVRTYSAKFAEGSKEPISYHLRVEYSRDGKTLVEERNVDLLPGMSQDLVVDFDAKQGPMFTNNR